MKSLVGIAALSVLLCSGTSLAQNAVQVADLILLPHITTARVNTKVVGEWRNLLSTTLRTSQQKDLLMRVSLEAGLYTDTAVRAKNGGEDSSMAKGTIEVRILVDGKPAQPGSIIVAERNQHLMTHFGGLLASCTDYNDDGVITVEECLFTGEELRRVLSSLNANAFVFTLDDVGSGAHNVQVQARVTLDSNATKGSAGAGAWIGKGTVSVEEVRLVKGTDLTL